MARPRYDVELTAGQRRALFPSCDWGCCDEPTIGVRRESDSARWVSVCERHVRMGNTLVLGREAVLHELPPEHVTDVERAR